MIFMISGSLCYKKIVWWPPSPLDLHTTVFPILFIWKFRLWPQRSDMCEKTLFTKKKCFLFENHIFVYIIVIYTQKYIFSPLLMKIELVIQVLCRIEGQLFGDVCARTESGKACQGCPSHADPKNWHQPFIKFESFGHFSWKFVNICILGCRIRL